MTPAVGAAASAKSPLDAAQKIVAELEGMSDSQKVLALKFASETLGLQLSSAHAEHSQASVHSASAVSQGGAVAPGHFTDIKSFTAIKRPKSDTQFAAVVAYFYQFEAKPNERKESIDQDTMKEAARLVGRRQVSRWAMTLTNAKNAGYLSSVGHGKFGLSPVGENLVAITLPGNAVRPQGTQSGRAKKVGKKKPTTNNAGKSG
jgi:hypothetical protein